MLKRSAMHMLIKTIIPPAATPWTARPAISMAMLVAIPQIREPMKKSTIAVRSEGFRPQISLTFDQVGMDAASVRK